LFSAVGISGIHAGEDVKETQNGATVDRIELPEKILGAIHAHAALEQPRECCGVVINAHGKYQYMPCRNMASERLDFEIHPDDWVAAEDAGTITMIVHSHVGIPPTPSQSDLMQCERHGLPWLIVNWPTGETSQFLPTGYKAPLTGRTFRHGVLDCYQLVKDYYEGIGVYLPDPNRADQWWVNGQNLYLDNYEKAGFVLADDIKEHDVLLMQLASPVPNHAGVMMADGNFIHHQTGRLSCTEVYGGWYRKITTHVLRHRSLMQ